MNEITSILFFSLAVLLYRAAWAKMVKPNSIGFKYGYTFSFLLYFLAGFVVGQSRGISFGIWAGAAVAIVEVTLGVTVAEKFGAYDETTRARLHQNHFRLFMILLQVIFGAMLGMLGAFVAQNVTK